MNTHAEPKKENKSQAMANMVAQKKNDTDKIFPFADNRPEAISQRKMYKVANNSRQVSQLRAFQKVANHFKGSTQLILGKEENSFAVDSTSSSISGSQISGEANIRSNVIQRLVGAAAPIAGHDEILPGTALNRGAAAAKIAAYINRRTRETAPGVHAESSTLGANNPGNLYVKSDYSNGAGMVSSLETWSELTGTGGGYVKRVRIIENGNTLMDRVMNDPAPTALNTALAANADAGAAGPAANRRYGSVHAVAGGDAGALNIAGTGDREADNITKIVGEGARFGWLAEKLSNGTIGNTSTGVLKTSIKIPQEGTLEMDPTFQQLWGAWDVAFGRSYMKNRNAAIKILKQRLMQGLRTKRDNDVPGAAPLASGAIAGGQVTSLLRVNGDIALMPGNAGINGANIISGLGMKWTSEH